MSDAGQSSRISSCDKSLTARQSSYTPFMTENIYQALRPFIPEDLSLPDTRSVHFLSFPEVKEEYFDSDIERQVKRMQSVIELTRYLREKNNLSLKVGRINLIIGLQYSYFSRRRSRSSSSSPPRHNTSKTSSRYGGISNPS